jgi:HEAT repeats
MTCKEIQAVIVEYLDQAGNAGVGGSMDDGGRGVAGAGGSTDGGEPERTLLSAATMAAVASHLATCGECRQEAEELQELMQAMRGIEMQRPGPGLRENFQLMLQSELNMVVADKLLHEGNVGGSDGRMRDMGESGGAGDGRGRVVRRFFPIWNVAAAVVLLFGGIGIGVLLSSRRASNPNPNPNTPEQLVTMQKEIKEMKEVLMFSLIGDESASQRIKAVSYAEEMSNPDQKVINALVSTLNHDKNVNVRLAALYSLGSWADNQMVRDSLVTSLSKQTEPLIQVMLINLLAEKKDSRIVAPIQDILSNKKTLPVVKDAAEKSLKTL